MAEKSAFARSLDYLMEEVEAPILAMGFKRRNRVYRRQTEPGLWQLVDFAMAPGHSAWYGRFSIYIGIYLDEVHAELGFGQHPPVTIHISDCSFTTLSYIRGPFTHAGELDLRDKLSDNIEKVERTLADEAAHVLHGTASRLSLVAGWHGAEDSRGLSHCDPRAMAVVAARIGFTSLAVDILRATLKRRGKGRGGFEQKRRILDLAARLKIQL